MSLLGNHLLLKAHDMTANFCAIYQTVAVTTKTIYCLVVEVEGMSGDGQSYEVRRFRRPLMSA